MMKCQNHLVEELHLDSVPDAGFNLPDAITVMGGNALCYKCVVQYFFRAAGNKSLVDTNVQQKLGAQLIREKEMQR